MATAEQTHQIETDETRAIVARLQAVYPRVDCYRYSPASIRIRIIDERLQGLDRVERDELVSPLLNDFPEETQSDITMLLLLTEDELESSPANVEFEHPTPLEL